MNLDKHERKLLLDNSVERVINTSIKIIEQTNHEDAGMNLDDWYTLKLLTVKLWNNARNEAFIANQGEAKSGKV
jgi:hypothetical protein